MYRIVDYVNDRVVATNLMGDNAVFNTRFSTIYWLKRWKFRNRIQNLLTP